MRLDDHVGPRFAALLRPEAAAALDSAIMDGLAARGAALVADAALDPWLASLEAAAALVRPDRQLLALAPDPQGVAAFLDRF